MFIRIRQWFAKEWRSIDGPLAIFADAWAFMVDPEARQLYKNGAKFDPPRGGMSVREARMRGLIP